MDDEMENFMAVGNTLQRSQRFANENCDRSMWERGYRDWRNKKFKQSLQITRESFELILEETLMDLIKMPTPVKPYPIPPETQLALTFYRLAHGCSLSTLEDVFGWSISAGDQTFNHVCRILVQRLYNRCVKLPNTEGERRVHVEGFLENYEFPCVGVWDGFHVYISSKLKNYFSL